MVEEEWGQNLRWNTLKPLCFQTGVKTELCSHTTKDGCWAFGILVLQDCASPISLTLAPSSLNLLQALAYNLSLYKHKHTQHFPPAKQYVGAMGNSDRLHAAKGNSRIHKHTHTQNQTVSEQGMDIAYVPFRDLFAPWLYCSFQEPRDLI